MNEKILKIVVSVLNWVQKPNSQPEILMYITLQRYSHIQPLIKYREMYQNSERTKTEDLIMLTEETLLTQNIYFIFRVIFSKKKKEKEKEKNPKSDKKSGFPSWKTALQDCR